MKVSVYNQMAVKKYVFAILLIAKVALGQDLLAPGNTDDNDTNNVRVVKNLLLKKIEASASPLNRLKQISSHLTARTAKAIFVQLEEDTILLSLLRCTHQALDEYLSVRPDAPNIRKDIRKVDELLVHLIIWEYQKNKGLPSDVVIDLQLQRMWLMRKLLLCNLELKNTLFQVDLSEVKQLVAFVKDNVICDTAAFHHYARPKIVEAFTATKEAIKNAEQNGYSCE